MIFQISQLVGVQILRVWAARPNKCDRWVTRYHQHRHLEMHFYHQHRDLHYHSHIMSCRCRETVLVSYKLINNFGVTIHNTCLQRLPCVVHSFGFREKSMTNFYRLTEQTNERTTIRLIHRATNRNLIKINNFYSFRLSDSRLQFADNVCRVLKSKIWQNN